MSRLNYNSFEDLLSDINSSSGSEKVLKLVSFKKSSPEDTQLAKLAKSFKSGIEGNIDLDKYTRVVFMEIFGRYVKPEKSEAKEESKKSFLGYSPPREEIDNLNSDMRAMFGDNLLGWRPEDWEG